MDSYMMYGEFDPGWYLELDLQQKWCFFSRGHSDTQISENTHILQLQISSIDLHWRKKKWIKKFYGCNLWFKWLSGGNCYRVTSFLIRLTFWFYSCMFFVVVGLDEGSWNSNNPPGSFDRGVSMLSDTETIDALSLCISTSNPGPKNHLTSGSLLYVKMRSDII